MGVCHLARILNILLGDAIFAIADVLPYGCGKQHGFLTHYPDVLPQPADIQLPNVNPIYQDL